MLRKIPPDSNKSKISLEIAENKLKTAKTAFEKELFGPTIIYGYTSMFHSARALLYKDGIQEKKSHLPSFVYKRILFKQNSAVSDKLIRCI